MSVTEAITDALRDILGRRNIGWTVATAPPAGHIGPCLSVVKWRLREGDRSSLGDYPRMEIEMEMGSVDEADIERAYAPLMELARTQWADEQFRAINGRITAWSCERDEGARERTFIGVGTIEYQVHYLEA